MDINSVIKLNDGNTIPQIALGVFKSADETKEAVLAALKAGYRHIDTAAIYRNEEAVGQAIKESGINREELFITTKLWNQDIRDHKVEEALETSLKKLGLDYVDLYLIHWPATGYVDAYLEMEKLQAKGKIRSIGVSNFKQHHLETLMEKAHILPSVNQMEYNPQFQDDELLEYCKEKGIAFEAWSPLGHGNCLDNEKIKNIADKYNKSSAQVILRWLLQKGIIILPKSVHESRIIENKEIYDFELTNEEMEIMKSLNTGIRTGADPDTFDF